MRLQFRLLLIWTVALVLSLLTLVLWIRPMLESDSWSDPPGSVLSPWVAIGLVILVSWGIGALWTWWEGERIARGLSELEQLFERLRKHDYFARLDSGGALDFRQLEKAIKEALPAIQGDLSDLQGARGRLEAVLEAMQEGVLVTDAQGVIILANRALRSILRFSGSAVGLTPAEVYRSPELMDGLERVRLERAPARLELTVRVPEERRILAHLSPWGEMEARGGAVVVLHDVTEMRRLEQVRRDFVANASHELRTPVAAIKGYAELLLEGEALPASSVELVETIERNARRLSALIDDILRLARIESQRRVPERRPVDVESTVFQAVEALKEVSRTRNVTLQVRVPPGLPPVLAEPLGLEQIFHNLIENALKYTPPGGRVSIAAQQKGQEIGLWVEDTGVGIPPEELHRVFERFYRVDSARSRAAGGTGLGLAIVKHLVQAYQGRIEVRSVYGAGSVFTVTLPATGPVPDSAGSSPPETQTREKRL